MSAQIGVLVTNSGRWSTSVDELVEHAAMVTISANPTVNSLIVFGNDLSRLSENTALLLEIGMIRIIMRTIPNNNPQKINSASNLIDLNRVSVNFGRTAALSDLTVGFEAGSTVALVGSNGSGKTTLLRLLAGLQQPTKGTISPRPLPAVAYVAQHQHQHAWMPLTVAEVLKTGRYGDRGLLGRLKAEDKVLIAQASARLGVEELVKRPFSELSGGQKQRVLVATALAVDAPILLLDEPITGLDIPSQERILKVIEGEAVRDRLVVISTHHLEEARRCDRVLLLRNQIVAEGVPAETLTPDALRMTFGDRVVTDNGVPAVFDDHGHDHEHDHFEGRP